MELGAEFVTGSVAEGDAGVAEGDASHVGGHGHTGASFDVSAVVIDLVQVGHDQADGFQSQLVADGVNICCGEGFGSMGEGVQCAGDGVQRGAGEGHLRVNDGHGGASQNAVLGMVDVGDYRNAGDFGAGAAGGGNHQRGNMIVEDGAQLTQEIIAGLAALFQQDGDDFGSIHGGAAAQTQNAVTAGFLGHFVSLVHHVFHGFSGDVIISDIVYALFIQGLGDLLGQTGHLHALVVDHEQFLCAQHTHCVLDGGDTANAEGDGALLCVVAELFIGSIHSEKPPQKFSYTGSSACADTFIHSLALV